MTKIEVFKSPAQKSGNNSGSVINEMQTLVSREWRYKYFCFELLKCLQNLKS